MLYLGEIAALVVSLLWTAGALFFTHAGKRIGSFSVNAYRIVMSAILLGLTHLVIFGTILPSASFETMFWLGLSGIVAIGIGDYCLFTAFVTIGPRLSVLVLASSPIFASIGAYVLLGETLAETALIGVAITLVGIVLVVLKKEENQWTMGNHSKVKWTGIFLAFIAAISQGTGLVLAKKGMSINPHQLTDPLTATFIRMMIAAIFILIVVLVIGKTSEIRKSLHNRDGIKLTFGGAFFGGFIGITLLMVAITYTQTGVAQTLMSLRPIIIIPVTYVIYRQRTSLNGILGAIIAIFGISILFLQ